MEFGSDMLMDFMPSSDYGSTMMPTQFDLPSIDTLSSSHAEPMTDLMSFSNLQPIHQFLNADDQGSDTSSPVSMGWEQPSQHQQPADWHLSPVQQPVQQAQPQAMHVVQETPLQPMTQKRKIVKAPRTSTAKKTRSRKTRLAVEQKTQPKKKGRKRKRGTLDKEALALRRKRHNEVEIRRRKKIADSFAQLRAITDCTQANKGSILKTAIDLVGKLKAQVKLLESQQQMITTAIDTSAMDTTPSSFTSLTSDDEAQSSVATVICDTSGSIRNCNLRFLDTVGIASKQDLANGGGLVDRFTAALAPALRTLQTGTMYSADFFQTFPSNKGQGQMIQYRGTAFRSSGSTIQVILVPLDDSHSACSVATVEAHDTSVTSGSLSAASSSPRSIEYSMDESN